MGYKSVNHVWYGDECLGSLLKLELCCDGGIVACCVFGRTYLCCSCAQVLIVCVDLLHRVWQAVAAAIHDRVLYIGSLQLQSV